MSSVYALINNGVVENSIVAEESFLTNIENDYDLIIQIDSLDPMPGVNWTYIDEVFTAPVNEIIEIPE